MRIPNFGKKSLNYIIQTLKALDLSLGMDTTHISWLNSLNHQTKGQDVVADIQHKLDTSVNFADSIDDFVQQYSQTLNRKNQQRIFIARIVCTTTEIPTLEEIGQELGITRERVRQIEHSLVTRLVKVIFGGFAARDGFKTDVNFAAMWRSIAYKFDGLDEVTITAFTEAIVTTWNISSGDFEKYFNFVSVIFTGKVKSHLVTESGTNSSFVFEFVGKFKHASDHKISHFRLGERRRKYLAKMDVYTLADLLELLYYPNKVSPGIQAILEDMMLVPLDINGSVNWAEFISMKGFRPIERKRLDSPQIFLSELYNIMSDALRKINVPIRSQKVFELRTSKHPSNRYTLKMVAEELLGNEKFQPYISRDQKVFLLKLHEIFVEKDYSQAYFSLSDELIGYFEDAKEIYKMSDNKYDTFGYLIARRFGLNHIDIDIDSISLLWTILAGYTPHRYFHLTLGEREKRRNRVHSKVLPSMIRLSGFRDIF
jgi:hypothetical protein